MKSSKPKTSAKSLEKRLKAIREAVDDTVVITVGMRKDGKVDILNVKSALAPPDTDTIVQDDMTSYIG